MGWFLSVLGVLALGPAIFDWDWFMNSPRTQDFVKRFGRTKARLIYGSFGVLFLVLGVLTIAGVIHLSR